MSHDSQTSTRREMTPASKMSFAVAACAFAAAGIGLLINQWMSGWMAVGGMAGVGLFYLAVGLLNLGSTGSVGTNTIDVVEQFPERLEIIGLSAHSPSVAVSKHRLQANATSCAARATHCRGPEPLIKRDGGSVLRVPADRERR